MCMLCGCDYLDPIKGVGAKTALKLVKEYDDMEGILAHLRKGKNPPPEDWPYEEARKLFKTPEVRPAKEIDVRPARSHCNLSRSVAHQQLSRCAAQVGGSRRRRSRRLPRTREGLLVRLRLLYTLVKMPPWLVDFC